MSDSKRTGSRDISDLKARLGLKKGGAAPTTGQTRTNGGVVAPPGLNLPPPPGVHQPPQPVIPNAADDPFGAMNAMAAVGTVQRAPEIVIVNDGRPVEHVGQTSMAATIAKIAIPFVIALVIGIAVGKIGEGASSYNAGLSDAKLILGNKETPSTIISLKQTLSAIDTLLDEAKTRNQFRPDTKFDKELEALVQKLEVNTGVVFKAKQNALDADMSGQIISFYAGVAEVKSMIDTHLKAAKADDLAFKKSKEKMDAASLKEDENAPLAGQLRFAILIQAPTDQDKVEFGAKLVEVGGVYCGASEKPAPKCPEGESPTAVAYRSEVGAPILTKGELATSSTDAVPTKKVVQLISGGVRDTLIKGADGVASETYYQRRLRLLYDRVRGKTGNDGKPTGGLINQGNDLERRMTTETSKGTRFSFGM